jgi:zinc/manganese transport system ATP-binding protein
MTKDAAAPVVELQEVRLAFGARTLVDELSLTVSPGEFVVVIGPNGAGKTTLLRTVLGLVRPARGRVLVSGHEPSRGDPAVGYVPQQRPFDDGTPLRGRDLVGLGLDGHRWGIRLRHPPGDPVQEAIDAVDAGAFGDAPLGTLSGGEQQRLRVAQAIVSRPRVLLCDEPLLSLDLASQHQVVRVIARHRDRTGAAVLFVTHEITPALPYVDRVLYLAAGGWAAGSPEEVFTDRFLTRLYGVPVSVIRVGDRLVVVGPDDASSAHVHEPAEGER